MNGKTMLNGVPYFSDTQVIELTRAEYDALPNSKYTDGVLYCIKDEGAMKGDTFSPIIYSLAEREVGVWTDGKPLYQKTWEYQSASALTQDTDLISFPNVCIKELKCVAFNTTTRSAYVIPYSLNGYETCLRYADDYIKIKVQNDSWGTNYKFLITAQYTKTTDNPGTGKWTTSGVPAHHYSTEEQVIGTWIDGKPLYEKTIVGNDLGNSSTTTTLFTATVERIQKYDLILKRGNMSLNANVMYNGTYHFRLVPYSDTELQLIRSNADGWQDWYPVVTIQYTKTTD